MSRHVAHSLALAARAALSLQLQQADVHLALARQDEFPQDSPPISAGLPVPPSPSPRWSLAWKDTQVPPGDIESIGVGQAPNLHLLVALYGWWKRGLPSLG